MSVRHSITRTEGRIEGGMMPSGLKPRLGYPIAIAGTGAALPAATLASTEIDEAAGKPQGWAQKSSGIVYRHVATSETVIELAAAAAERAIAAANITKQDIDCIIAAGALPHQPIPTSAALIQKALGLATSGVPAFDVNATCLGFMAALDVAGALISAGRYATILITAADMPSHGTDWRNPELKAMFGDGAAAAIVRRSEQPGQGILALRLETYSEGATACELRSGGSGLNPHKDLDKFMEGAWFEMDGPLAYRVSARHMSGFLERLLGEAGVTLDDIDLVVPHQASAHGLHLMRKRLGIPPEKLVDLLSVRGNQVSASIPSMLDHALSHGLAKTGGTILLIGTAAGITLGGAVVRL